ncbi:TPA: trypsin-like serine protease, partial [Listeria monocytogenes]|nr:trypsin-like serine protease [Listeria monocytogenes]
TTLFLGGLTSNATEITPDFLEQIEFRKEFGLETNIDKIKLLNQNVKLHEDSNFEIPLTKAEEEELEERFKIQNEYIPKIKKLLDEKYKNEDFTLYINQENKGEIVIKLKQASEHEKVTVQKDTMVNELKSVGPMFNYRIEDGNYSESDLNKISEQMWEKKGQQNLDFDSTSVDVINEKVIVGIIDYTIEKERQLRLAFGDFPLEVVQVDPPNNHRGSYGGEKIVNSRGGACSSGYYAKSGSNHYLITAGHCSRSYNASTGAVTNHTSDTYKYGTTTLGKVNSIRYGGKIDALTISVSSGNANSNININGAVRKMTSSQARNGDTVGQAVCKLGYATGKSQCGTLKSKNVSYTIAGAAFTELRGTNLTSTGGDSGGTMYNSFQYLGINKGSGGGYTQVYSQIGEINYSLGLSTYLQ